MVIEALLKDLHSYLKWDFVIENLEKVKSSKRISIMSIMNVSVSVNVK